MQTPALYKADYIYTVNFSSIFVLFSLKNCLAKKAPEL